MLHDHSQRQQATDPRRSFIVQAPAGSGKTELLTQRYLRLLSTVKSPEQIIALTFTRKAASEMRERILRALTAAAQGCLPNSEHQQLTYRYANDALRQSQQYHWQLLDNPGRLRVITIDSLCQLITHAIPLYERQTPYATISADPQSLYQQAVRACIATIVSEPNFHPLIEVLLEHLDNRQDRLLDLLSSLLVNREQWLAPIFGARNQTREHYEDALFFIEQHELARFLTSVPVSCRDELCQLSRELALIVADNQSIHAPLADWYDFEQLDGELITSLAALLLTKDNKLRKGFDHHVGLKANACDKQTYQRLKAASQALLAELSSEPDFLPALLRVKKLPTPYYDDTAWEVLQALLHLLPLLAAHLQLVFRASNEVDFTAVSDQALLALGDDDAPTDLALYLDYAIHHLLVDEFQDTSIGQFQLLTKLVQGWLPDDGKTLFIVGDPMQSIYRFRQAEVGLFLKAQQHGIGPVYLTPLALSCNFRSTTTIVDWVNQQFRHIFPRQDDIEMGAISFHPAMSILAHTTDSGIYAHQCRDKTNEAAAIVALISREMQQHPDQQIAILVRSRHQLSAIVPLLRHHNIPFQGVDIERLSNLPSLQDMLTLTKSLLLPANRLAWLALLRSPWAGIELTDLHKIANFDKKKSIHYALANVANITGLSAAGMTRARFIYSVMQEAFATRHQQPLTDWLMNVVRQLHGDAIFDPSQQVDLEQFWALLARFNKDGQLDNWQRFEAEFNQLYSERVTSAPLQIMTIHKAKGLEFDCVILPSLGSKPQQADKPLLRWLKLSRQNQEDLLLLSPIRAANKKECRLYNYLGDIGQEKEQFERQRLLYVAVTRAKKRLYLFDCHDKPGTNSFRQLLQHQEFLDVKDQQVTLIHTLSVPVLHRLPLAYYTTPVSLSLTEASTINLNQFGMSNAQHAGIIAHELLQWLCDNHPETLAQLPWPMVRNRFKNVGFTYLEQQQAVQRLQEQITNMLATEIGQWLCQKHQDERNEYELLVEEDGQMVTRIIDRTFYDKGICWIIDFKTGLDDQNSQKAHYQQVNNYANILANIRDCPIHCGLYYLNTGRWLSWPYVEVVHA